MRKLAEIRRRSRTIDATSLVNHVSGKRDEAAVSRAEDQDDYTVGHMDDGESDPRRTPDGMRIGGFQTSDASEGEKKHQLLSPHYDSPPRRKLRGIWVSKAN